MEHCARVQKFSSQGNAKLIDAIKSGMITGEALSLCKSVSDENQMLLEHIEEVEKENRDLKARMTYIERMVIDNRKDRCDAYAKVISDESDFKRYKYARTTIYIGLFAAGMVATMILTVAAVLK